MVGVLIWIKQASFVAVSAAALFLVACAPDSDERAIVPQEAAKGPQVFEDNCTPCHGSDGGGPELSQLKALSLEERAERIRQHPRAGPVLERLSANELADLMVFLKSDTPAESPARGPGAQVFNDNCGACHHSDGGGPPLSELKELSHISLENRMRKHPVAGQIPQRLMAIDLAYLIEFLESE